MSLEIINSFSRPISKVTGKMQVVGNDNIDSTFIIFMIDNRGVFHEFHARKDQIETMRKLDGKNVEIAAAGDEIIMLNEIPDPSSDNLVYFPEAKTTWI